MPEDVGVFSTFYRQHSRFCNLSVNILKNNSSDNSSLNFWHLANFFVVLTTYYWNIFLFQSLNWLPESIDEINPIYKSLLIRFTLIRVTENSLPSVHLLYSYKLLLPLKITVIGEKTVAILYMSNLSNTFILPLYLWEN